MTSSVISSGSSAATLQQRWTIHQPDPALVTAISSHTGLNPLLAKVLVNQGIQSTAAAEVFLNPELETLPTPQTEFEDLAPSLALLRQAIDHQEAIAICGDYDADGMTSTALLLRALNGLGAVIDYAIPSRMNEGYGINTRIVEDFAESGVKIILTVDNGIAAYEPVARARELGVSVIITDHHDLPPKLPPANAILNPKLLAEDSPYRSLAGVGGRICFSGLPGPATWTGEASDPITGIIHPGDNRRLSPIDRCKSSVGQTGPQTIAELSICRDSGTDSNVGQ